MFKKIFYLVWMVLSLAVTAQEPEPAPSPSPAPSGIESPANPEEMPSTTETTVSYEGAFVKMLLALAGLVAMVFFTIWVFRKIGQQRLGISSNKSIKILERRPLSQKSMLYLIEVSGKRVLISESQLEVRHVTTLEEQIQEDEE